MMQFMDNPEDQIEVKLPGRQRAIFRRIDASLKFDQPAYAVNWFNTRSRWLYEFYNFLAAGSVKAIGGAPFFKGRLLKRLHGVDSDSRDLILVVRYPALTQFKVMLESIYFQLLSILRLLAVKDFTFGFMKRRAWDTPLEPVSKMVDRDEVYLVHHFRGDPSIVDDLIACGRDLEIETVFAGTIGAIVSTGSRKSDLATTPCLMDAIVIFRGPNAASTEALSQSGGYQSVMSKSVSSFVGTYRRIL